MVAHTRARLQCSCSHEHGICDFLLVVSYTAAPHHCCMPHGHKDVPAVIHEAHTYSRHQVIHVSCTLTLRELTCEQWRSSRVGQAACGLLPGSPW